MPNWSFNTMRVQADDENEKAEVQRLRSFIRRVETDKDGTQIENPFSFQNVIPMPEELKDTIAPTKEPTSKEAKALRAKYGFDNWYDWRWEHWGTKWDSCDASYDKELQENDELDLAIRFDTAWSFPTPVVLKLSRLFPTLTFNYDANEESGAYDFTVEIKDGEVIYYAEWEHKDPDDPDSEMVEVSKPVEDFWKES